MRTVLCFGDSNTWGAATVPRPDGRYEPNERWPGVLGGELGSGWRVIEEGLSGRTGVYPDPIEGRFLDGSAYLLPCLLSHSPLDAVLIMLGTNDLKARFNLPPGDIAAGIGVLLDIVAKSAAGPGATAPQALVICPPPILAHHGERADLVEMFAGGREKSIRLASHYAQTARLGGAAFLDAGAAIESSAFDGIHLDPEAHAALGRAVARRLRAMFESPDAFRPG